MGFVCIKGSLRWFKMNSSQDCCLALGMTSFYSYITEFTTVKIMSLYCVSEIIWLLNMKCQPTKHQLVQCKGVLSRSFFIQIAKITQIEITWGQHFVENRDLKTNLEDIYFLIYLLPSLVQRVSKRCMERNFKLWVFNITASKNCKSFCMEIYPQP